MYICVCVCERERESELLNMIEPMYIAKSFQQFRIYWTNCERHNRFAIIADEYKLFPLRYHMRIYENKIALKIHSYIPSEKDYYRIVFYH